MMMTSFGGVMVAQRHLNQGWGSTVDHMRGVLCVECESLGRLSETFVWTTVSLGFFL